MIEFEKAGKIYQITFYFPDKHSELYRRYTHAKLSIKIINEENPNDYAWETIDETFAKCNIYCDEFNKNRGRFQALTNLSNSVLFRDMFNKYDRKMIWEKYFEKYGYPPKNKAISYERLVYLLTHRKHSRKD